MPRLGTRIDSFTTPRSALRQRIQNLNAELLLLASECKDLAGMDAQDIVPLTDRLDRRITMLRHGVTLVRTEAKIIARAEKLAVAGKAVRV